MVRLLIILAVAICMGHVTRGQNFSAFSPNDLFLLTVHPNQDKKKFHLSLYSTRHTCKIQSLDVLTDKKEEIRSIQVNSAGVLALIKTNMKNYVIDLREPRVIAMHSVVQKVAISNSGGFYLLANSKEIVRYNSHGQELSSHRINGSAGIIGFHVLPDDKSFLVRTTRKQFMLYNFKRKSYARKTYGTSYVVNDQDHTITIMNKVSGNINLYVYEYPSMKRVDRSIGSKSIRNYVKELQKAAKESGTNARISTPKILDNTSSLSTKGTYCAMSLTWGDQTKSLMVIEVATGKIVKILNTEEPTTTPINYDWITDELLGLQMNPLLTSVLHIESASINQMLNYAFDYKEDERSVKPKQQEKRVQVSPNYRYACIADKKSDGLFLKAAAIGQEKSFVPNVEFEQYSPSSSMILCKREGNLGIVLTRDIERDLGLEPLKFYPFVDECSFEPEDILGEAQVPLDYDYPRFQRIKHVSEIRDSTNIDLIFKTMSIVDSTTTLQVQLLDHKGSYYTGGAEEEYKYIWCNFILKYGLTAPEQLSRFSISEVSEENPAPLAISLVLDYSGSMGQHRIDAMLAGLERFFNGKREFDGISIIKYDENIVEDGRFTTDETRLMQNLNKTRYDKMRGSTALLDGVSSGSASVAAEDEFAEHIVIVITDGNENASKLSKNAVILDAIRTDTRIFTLGFGDFVSEEYLKSISYNTEGSYYRIYKTDELKWIFEDIYNKISNYYRITFDTPKPGNYAALIKLCLPNNTQDSLAMSFSTRKVDLDAIDPTSDVGFEIPFDQELATDTTFKGFSSFSDITDFSGVTSTPIKPYSSTPDKDPELSPTEQAFNELTLPKFEFVFDKTRITNNPEKEVAEVIAFMKKYPETSLEIGGHTDSDGSYEYNIKLSQRRAEKVLKLLVEAGADKSRLTPVGYGDTQPISDNKSEEGKQLNRRVEFILIE